MNQPCNSAAAYWMRPRLRSFESHQQTKKKTWTIFRQYPDKRFSFMDCTSFAIMKRLGIGTAFAFDEDFRRLGKWIGEPIIEAS